MVLNELVDAAIDGEYYTADGVRVMLPLQALVDLGLVHSSAVEKLKQRLSDWEAAQQRFTGETLTPFTRSAGKKRSLIQPRPASVV